MKLKNLFWGALASLPVLIPEGALAHRLHVHPCIAAEHAQGDLFAGHFQGKYGDALFLQRRE